MQDQLERVERPSGPQRVACRLCGADYGDQCRTAAGRRRSSHVVRWDDWRARMCGQFVVRVLRSDERLGVMAGEEYEAIAYWLDPGEKVTLLRRIPDGHEPECNQYWDTVQWMRWI